jgi:hypothetical protein
MSDQPPVDRSGAGAVTFGAPEARRDRPLPLRQMGIGELIDAAVRLYRLEWKVLMGIVAFVLIPITFLEVWVTEVIVGPIGQVPGPTSDLLGPLIIVSLAFGAVQFLVIQPFLVAAITRAAADVYLGEPVGIGRTYRFALGRLHLILWITILATLATLLGLVLLVIPGIIVLVRLAFAAPVLVVEDLRGRKAIGRSWRLAKGHFWRILGTLVLAGLIVAIVAAIVSIPGELVVQGLGPGAWPISALVSAFASVLTTPFSMLVIVLLYFDLRIRKEGFDMEVMARELAAAP